MQLLQFVAALCFFCAMAAPSFANEGSVSVENALDDLEVEVEEDEVIVEEVGVGAGYVVPMDWSIPDHRGRLRRLSDLSGRNGIVLFFVRSAVWSPYCRLQLQDLSARGSFIQDTGYNIVVVSNDTIRKLSIFAKEYDFPYPLLADKNSKLIKQFGLFDKAYDEGTTYYGISRPAAYIIGNDGLILRKFYSENIAARPSIKYLREALYEFGEYAGQQKDYIEIIQ